jgi:peptidoglycan/LPS O-acetylase OafA/YrhL
VNSRGAANGHAAGSATVTVPRPAPLSTEPVAGRYRPDIQGLRAVAILLVVLYHADVPGVQGGYVGVDVFFVISGYLITGQLVREAVRSGRLSLAGFYLRRVRRLLPSAVIVIVVTLLAARAFAPPLLTLPLSLDSVFAAAYTLNYRLAVEGINYQNAGATPSALQHLWSLGVEEQFYLLWPLVIIAAIALTRRWWRDLLPVLFLVVAAASLYISQFLLTSDGPMSYFSAQSRAWEFAAGALVSLATGQLARLPVRIRRVLFAVGLVLIATSGAFYNSATQFPGVHALLPVAGTALVIGAGCGERMRGGVILENRLMQWLGQVSYPWYLWHWPVLVLAPYIWPRVRLSWPVNLALAALSLALAAATHYGLELPARRPRFRPAVWSAIGLTLMAVSVTSGIYIDRSLASMLTGTVPRVRVAAAAQLPQKSLFSKGPVADPFAGSLTAGPVSPTVIDAVSDVPHYPGECVVDFSATTSPGCLVDPAGQLSRGPVTSNRVVLLGDSHAAEWYGDVSGVARAFGWDTEVLAKEGCPLASISIMNASLNQPYTECDQWRTKMFQRLDSEPPPKMIIVSSLNYYSSDNAYVASGWKKTISALQSTGAPIVYLRDTPFPGSDIPTCVSGALNDWAKCSFSRSTAYHPDPLMTGTAGQHGLAARVDVDGYLCPASLASCPAVLGGVLLYRDNSHVTNTAMSVLEPIFERQLQPLLRSITAKA